MVCRQHPGVRPSPLAVGALPRHTDGEPGVVCGSSLSLSDALNEWLPPLITGEESRILGGWQTREVL